MIQLKAKTSFFGVTPIIYTIVHRDKHDFHQSSMASARVLSPIICRVVAVGRQLNISLRKSPYTIRISSYRYRCSNLSAKTIPVGGSQYISYMQTTIKTNPIHTNHSCPNPSVSSIAKSNFDSKLS